MENTEPLVELLKQFTRQVLDQAYNFKKYSPPEMPHDISDYTMVTTETQDDIIRAILSELGDKHQFRGEWEVVEYITDYLADPKTSDPSIVLLDIAKGLRHPLQSYSFSAPVMMRSPVGYNISLGGRHNLRLESGETPEGGYRPVLTGTTEACTPCGAIEDAEQAIRLILGAALALNTAVLTFQTPGFNSQVPISISPRAIGPTFMEPALAQVASRCLLIVPRDLSDLETAQMRKGDGSSATQRIQRNLVKLAAADSDRAEEVRNATRLYLAGESSAASASSSSYGMAVTYYFMCLEALLMERTTKENIQARLTEAVAFRIGTSAEDRTDLRARVKKMYDDRSRFVHTGAVQEKPGMREACSEMVRLVLQKEIEEL